MAREDEELLKPTYGGTFEDQLKGLYDQIENRQPFSYDLNADPLYKQHKDDFIQAGKLAMKDTMGQAASLTGGYGSTYGQQVGQQTFDSYLQSLGDVIPELYNLAYKKYSDEGDKLLTLYGLTGDQRDTEYNRWRDELSDWNYDQEVARQREETEYNRRIDAEKTAASRQQQAYSNLYALIKASGYNPTDEELAAAGMTRAAAQAVRNEYQRGVDMDAQNMALKTAAASASSSGGGGGGSSGGGGGGGGGSGYSAQTAAIQQQLNAMGAGLDVDGIWGPLTQAAYERYMGGGSSGGGTKYTLQDFAGDVGSVKHSNQVNDLIKSYTQAAQQGLTDFSVADLKKYVTAHHL